MKHFELKGQIREAGNKAVVKAFRKQGLVPCNLYGQGLENVLFTVSEKDLKGLTNTPASYIVDLVLSDGKTYNAIIHELQFHPVKDNCLHVDFLLVDGKKPVSINVPLVFTGHPIGVRQGGKFVQNARSLRISAMPDDLPDSLTIVTDNIGLDKRITVEDLHFDNINILTLKSTVLCRVISTRQLSASAAAAAPAEEGSSEEEAAPAEA